MSDITNLSDLCSDELMTELAEAAVNDDAAGE